MAKKAYIGAPEISIGLVSCSAAPRPGSKNFIRNSYGTSTFDTETMLFAGVDSTTINEKWSDGGSIYAHDSDGNMYIFSNDMWLPADYIEPPPDYKNLWSDGNKLYYSYNTTHLVLKNNVWENQSWDGATEQVSGAYVWTDGINIYCGFGENALILQNHTWIEHPFYNCPDGTALIGMHNALDYYVWSDGTSIYCSKYRPPYTTYKLEGDTWTSYTITGWPETSFGGIIADGVNIYLIGNYFSDPVGIYKFNSNQWVHVRNIEKNPDDSFSAESLALVYSWSDGQYIYGDMGIGAYKVIGSGYTSVAHKVKTGYIGVPTEVPIYSGDIITTTIDNSNLSTYFEVTNSTYSFQYNSSSSGFVSNNKGVNSSTATSTWKAKQDITNASFKWAVSSESGYDKLTITVGSTTVASGASGTQSGSFDNKPIPAGTVITLQYSKDGSAASGTDNATLSDFSITVDTRVQTGTETIDKARRVKKVYIGDASGKARPCWSSEQALAYYGAIDSLPTAVNMGSAATTGTYALFAGGYTNLDSYSCTNTVTAYNQSLVKSAAPTLVSARAIMAAGTAGDKALFNCGGYYDPDVLGTIIIQRIDVYDSSLTHTTYTPGMEAARYGAKGDSIGNYAIFSSGICNLAHTVTDLVDAYDTSITRIVCANGQSSMNYYENSCHAGNYVMFMGGYAKSGGWTQSCVAYDTSLTKYSGTLNLTVSIQACSAASVGDYGIVMASGSGGSMLNIFDASLTRNNTLTPINGNYSSYTGSASTKDQALFVTYRTKGDALIFNASLTQSYVSTLTNTGADAHIWRMARAIVGDYVLFGGGNGSYVSNTVEAYKLM